MSCLVCDRFFFPQSRSHPIHGSRSPPDPGPANTRFPLSACKMRGFHEPSELTVRREVRGLACTNPVLGPKSCSNRVYENLGHSKTRILGPRGSWPAPGGSLASQFRTGRADSDYEYREVGTQRALRSQALWACAVNYFYRGGDLPWGSARQAQGGERWSSCWCGCRRTRMEARRRMAGSRA